MGDDQVAFGRAAELVRDIVQPSEAHGLPYIGLEHIEQETLKLTGWGSASDVSSAKFRFRKGDILLGKLRPYFRKVVRAPFDGICSTDIWVVRAKNGFDQGYLFYWMAAKDFVDFASGGSEGTRMPRAKWEYVARFTRPRISLPEQRAIAHILGTLDDKIELNRRMNETLEAMAQALFKSWFVDFDPVVVNAIKAGNPIPEKFADRAAHYHDNPDALGLPEDLLRLFPARFVDSELGPIPEGWEATTIGSEFDLTMGQSPPGSTYNEEGKGLPFFQGRRDFGFRYPSSRVYCTAPTRIAHTGNTLVSVRAPVGDINMAYETCCIGRGVAALRHKSGSRSYTYYYAILVLAEQLKIYGAEGTVFGAINKKQFQNLSSISPRPDIISLFEKLAYPIDENILSFEEESRTLAALRDTLLPKLISGELRVPNVEKILEDAQ